MRVSREILILGAILLLGALIRGLYLAEIANRPDFTNPGVDAGYHDYWARGIVTGDWAPAPTLPDPEIPKTPYFRPPGYTFFMAGVYRLTGGSYLGLRVAQMLIGILSIGLAFALGRRWFGARVGLIYAGLPATYWVFVYYEGELLEPVLLVALGLLLVYEVSLWADKVSPVRALYSGIVLGLFALVRPNILLFAPAALLWLTWIAHSRKDSRLLRTTAVGFFLGTVLTIAPVTIRNWVVAHEFVPISTNGGINLLIGNNPKADGFCVGEIPGLGRFETCYDYPQIVRNLESKSGRRMTHSEVSAYFSGQAKDYIRSHPIEVLKLTWKRALLFWGPKEIGHNKEDELERADSKVLRRIPIRFPLVLALSVVGAGLFLGAAIRGDSRRKDPAVQRQYEIMILAALFVGAYFVSYLPFFAAGRYRVPIVPILMLPAAYGIDRIVGFFIARRLVSAAVSILLILGAYALASLNPTGYAPDEAKWRFDRGADFRARGDSARAVREYEMAIELRPAYPQAHTNLGLALIDVGRADDAIMHFREALRIMPGEAIPHYGLGLAYSSLGRPEDAVPQFEQAVRIDPKHAGSQYELGVLLYAQGRLPESMSHLRRAITADPRMGMAHAALGIALQDSGEADEAAEQFRAALAISPEPVSYYSLGNYLAERGKLDEAIGHFREAVKMAPDYGDARRNLAVALYFRGDYAGAWNEVHLAKKHGVQFDPRFIRELTEKMPPPAHPRP